MGKRSLLGVLAAGLLAMGPAPEGHQTTVGLGYLQLDTDDDWKYDVRGKGAVVLLEHTLRREGGLTLRTAGSTAIGSRRYRFVQYPPWRSDLVLTWVVRVGWQGRFFGVEAGPGLWLEPMVGGPVLSTHAWAGHPLGHLWLATWPGEYIGDVYAGGAGAGLGHTSPHVRAQLSWWSTGKYRQLMTAGRLDIALREDLWIGLRGRTISAQAENQERRIVLTVSFDPRALSPPTTPPPAAGSPETSP